MQAPVGERGYTMHAFGRFWRPIKLFAVVIMLSAGGNLARADSDVVEVPAGAVAVVSHVPRDEGTISRAEIERAIVQTSAQSGTRAPAADDPDYRNVAAEALGELLDAVDIQGEAAEREISVTRTEVSAKLRRIRKSSFGSNKEYEEYLHKARLTQREVRLRVESQLFAKRIEASVISSVSGRGRNAKYEALRHFAANFGAKWRSRTLCAIGYVTSRCSNVRSPSTQTK